MSNRSANLVFAGFSIVLLGLSTGAMVDNILNHHPYLAGLYIALSVINLSTFTASANDMRR